MSNFLSKIKVKTALQAKRNKFPLSCSHITTSDFYQNVPIYCHEMIPKETIKLHIGSETRCAPLVNPLFGHIKTYYRAFFVPYRVIYPAWNDFIEGTPHRFANGNISLPSYVPLIVLNAIYSLFTTQSLGFATVSSTQSSRSDFRFITTAGGSTYNYVTLTAKGRLAYKILVSLGYKLNWETYHKDNSDENLSLSALPLLAFAKIWCDWYSNPQYDTTSDIEQFFADNNGGSINTASSLSALFNKVILLTYDLDYFTSAWDNPVSPNTGVVKSSIQVQDITLMGGVTNPDGSIRNEVGMSQINNPQGGVVLTPVIRSEQDTSSTPTTVSQISQYILDTLHSVTDFVTRYKMVGSRALDRYLAEYGIQLSSEKLRRSVYIGKFDTSFNIGDVTQTTPEMEEGTSTQFGVGSYTGKMIGGGDGTFEYTTDEYGLLIVTSFIVPRNNYVYGRPRMLSHKQALDFFKGDFDALGVQAIRQDELVTFSNGSVPNSTNYKSDGVFGFTPRYAEYKVANDNLSGDFLLKSKNSLLDGWYMARQFDPDSQLRHTATFCYADGSQYNNIWQDGDSGFDHFFNHYIFDVEVYAPMKPLFDMYDYSNEDGRTILANLNGTNVNS